MISKNVLSGKNVIVAVMLLMLLPQGVMASPQPADTSARAGRGFSARTNLLWDATSEPNLGFEVPLGKHFTLGAAAGLKSWPRYLAWDWDKENPVHWRNFAVVPELRFYFDRVYDGWFAGADVLYTHYNVCKVKFPFGLYPEALEYRLQGDVLGAGITGGYSWWLGDHWRMEAEIGVAVGYNWGERFKCEHCGASLGPDRRVVVVPKLGLNIVYNFRKREIKKKELLDTMQQSNNIK